MLFVDTSSRWGSLMIVRVIWGKVIVVTVAFHVTSHLIHFKCCIMGFPLEQLRLLSSILANTLRPFFMCTNRNLGSHTCSLDWWWCMGVAVAF